MIAPSKIDEVIEYAATENCDEAIVEQAIEEFAQLRARLAEAETLLLSLADAERTYRMLHDLNGDGSIEAGHAWDSMRHKGDKAIAFLHPPK